MRILVAAVILVGMAATAQAQSMSAPVYVVGDTWTYTNREVKVVKVDGETVVMQGGNPVCPTCLYSFDRNLALLRVEQEDGKTPDTSKFPFLPVGPAWKFLDFPLEPKKSWRISGPAFQRGQSRNYTVDLEVQGYEEVKSKAGTFKAFKIWRRWQVAGFYSGQEGNWSDTVWFSPEVKNNVKYTTTNRFGTEWELVSYSVK